MVTEITPGTDSKNVPSDAEILIDVKDVKIYFSVTAGFLIQRKIAENKAVEVRNGFSPNPDGERVGFFSKVSDPCLTLV